MRDPRIVVQSSDPRFAQRNPRMVRIRALRITYIRAQYSVQIHRFHILAKYQAPSLICQQYVHMYICKLFTGNRPE